MKRLLVFLVPLAAACVSPQAFILHSPMQPTSAQTVTYTATATDDEGVTRMEIWEDRNTLTTCNGMQCASRVSTQMLRRCDFSPAQTNATCTFTTTSGYPDSSFIGYRVVAFDAGGRQGTDGWIYYAAGAWPWPNNPIPIYGTGAPAEKLDVVFIPDTDYNGNNTQFINDVSGLVANGYFSTNSWSTHVRPWRGNWNLYVTYRTGDAQGYQSGCNSAPSNWTTMRSIVNSGGIVHTANLRDCGGIGDGSLFSILRGNNATLVHESGHSVFSLSDEYCCDGGYWEIGPNANVFSSQANCQNTAAATGCSSANCVQIGTTGWWHSDNNCLMASGNTFGCSDVARIIWLYTQCGNGTGC